MDISTLIGLVFALFAIVLGGVGTEFGKMIDIPSFFYNRYRSLGATFIAHPSSTSFKIFNIFLQSLKKSKN